MRCLTLTLPTPAENLALDEALLDWAESGDGPQEYLRLWEPAQPMVVVGRSSRVADEVHEEACAARDIPILRRASGGAAIVTGPGCLMYAVVLSTRLRPELRSITAAHQFALERMARALHPFSADGVMRQGTSDLALGNGRKISGNSLRCKLHHLLYHGTVLYRFPLELIGECLRLPPRQPAYRAGRSHAEFVSNLSADRAALCEAIAEAWDAREEAIAWPKGLVASLVRDRYSRNEWNRER